MGGFLGAFVGRPCQILSGEVIACAVFTPRGCVCVGRIGVQFRCLGMLALKHGLLRILQARVPLLLEVSHPAE